MSLEKVVEYIKKNSGGITNGLLELYKSGEYDASDGGNFDDTLSDGITIGYEMAMQDILKIIEVE